MSKHDNVTGVFLDADYERMIEVNLPLVETKKKTKYKNKIIEERTSQYGEVMFMGDMHIGHTAHSGNPFNAHLHFLEEHPHIELALMGDYIEYASKSSYVRDEVMDVDDQIDLLVKKLKPLKDRIIWMLYGNHEERHVRYTNSKRLLQGIANEIGVPKNVYIGKPQRGVYAVIKAEDKTYGVYAHHSLTSARINRALQLRRAGSQNVFSIIAQGHTHELAWLPRTFRQLEKTENGYVNVVRRQYLLATGCFMRDPSYAEARSYPYTVIGAPVVRFYADRDKLDEYDLSSDYKEYLTRGGIPFGAETGISAKFKRWLINKEKKRTPSTPILTPTESETPLKKKTDVLPPR